MSDLLKRLRDQHAKETGAERQEPTVCEPVMPPRPRLQTKNGRPRREFKKSDYAPNRLPLLDQWASERLVENPAGAAYCGMSVPVATLKLPNGRLAKTVVEYDRPDLRSDFKQYCRRQGIPLPPMRYFVGQLLQILTGRGWVVIADRSHRQRRAILKGVDLVGHKSWDGNEKSL